MTSLQASDPCQSADVAATVVATPPLGVLLAQAGHLDEARLEEALALARRWDVPLGAVLVAKGWLSSRELASTLADQAQSAVRRFAPYTAGSRADAA